MRFIQQQVQLHAGDRRRRFPRHVSLLAAHGTGPKEHLQRESSVEIIQQHLQLEAGDACVTAVTAACPQLPEPNLIRWFCRGWHRSVVHTSTAWRWSSGLSAMAKLGAPDACAACRASCCSKRDQQCCVVQRAFVRLAPGAAQPPESDRGTQRQFLKSDRLRRESPVTTGGSGGGDAPRKGSHLLDFLLEASKCACRCFRVTDDGVETTAARLRELRMLLLTDFECVTLVQNVLECWCRCIEVNDNGVKGCGGRAAPAVRAM